MSNRSSVSRFAASALVGASLIAGQIAVASAAAAADFGYGSRPARQRHVETAPPRHFGDRRERRRDRAGDAVAGMVLGIGALVVGAAIADAARHNQRTRDDYED